MEMQLARSVAIGMISALLLGCGGVPAGTQAPAGATTNTGGGGATAPATTVAPGATTSGGGNGNTGGGSGQIHLEIGGPIQMTVDQPFFAFGSRFGGPAGLALNFTTEGADGLATVTGVNDQIVIGYVSEELGASATTCTVSNWNIGATSGSGSFDCSEGFATKMDGTFLPGLTMKGSFEASQ
jgi:hypothetical protein